MPNFRIRLASAQVRNTRSRGDDTIWASLQLVVNGTPSPTVSWDGLGLKQVNGTRLPEGRDWNNGLHFFGTEARSNVQLDTGNVGPGDLIEVVFHVLNKGHGGAPTTDQYNAASKAITDSLCKSDGNIPGDDGGWICIAARIGAAIFGWLITDCDGPVAADRVQFKGADLDRIVPNPSNLIAQPETARTYHWSRNYAGSDSPTGCGSNSDYRIDMGFIRLP